GGDPQCRRAPSAPMGIHPSSAVHRRLRMDEYLLGESMKPMHLSAALAVAALLVSCGGNDDKVQFTSVVSFGDSLSDAGTYRVGTIAALGGGKFTVNGTGTSSYTWTEDLAVTTKTTAQC